MRRRNDGSRSPIHVLFPMPSCRATASRLVWCGVVSSAPLLRLYSSQVAALHTKLLSVCREACEAQADYTVFPQEWLFHHRYIYYVHTTLKYEFAGPGASCLSVFGRARNLKAWPRGAFLASAPFSCLHQSKTTACPVLARRLLTKEGLSSHDREQRPLERVGRFLAHLMVGYQSQLLVT